MPNYTTNYNLIKPKGNEYYNVDVFNQNSDILDTKLKEVSNNMNNYLLKPGLKYNSYTDWNLVTEPGFHALMRDTASNRPSKSFFYPLVFKYETNITQIAVPYYTMDSKVYMRHFYNGIWQNWRNIGDGCNADTVDGKHASDLQNYNNLTNKPASLPANGGNADTVDGKHAADFQKFFTYNTTVDFNTLTETGVYSILAGENKNAPSTCWGTLIVQTTGHTRQLWFSDKESEIYTREKNWTENKWTNWSKVNDGGSAANLQCPEFTGDLNNFKEMYAPRGVTQANIQNFPSEIKEIGGTNTGSIINIGHNNSIFYQFYFTQHNLIFERQFVDWNTPQWTEWERLKNKVTCSNIAPTYFLGNNNQHQVY